MFFDFLRVQIVENCMCLMQSLAGSAQRTTQAPRWEQEAWKSVPTFRIVRG